MTAKRPALGAGTLAFVVFALSGCAGLIYQSIWTQYLGLFLGHAAYAQSLVLAIFMGGMAGGAWFASRAASPRIHLRGSPGGRTITGLTPFIRRVTCPRPPIPPASMPRSRNSNS